MGKKKAKKVSSKKKKRNLHPIPKPELEIHPDMCLGYPYSAQAMKEA